MPVKEGFTDAFLCHTVSRKKLPKSSQGDTTPKRRTVSQILKEAENSTKKRIQLKVEQEIELKKIQKVDREKQLSQIVGRERYTVGPN